MRIAIVGSGIAGLSAAWGLAGRHEVVLFEAEDRLGGHTATVDIDYGGTPVAVDTGFIVYNTLNYPNLTAFFQHLAVPTVASDMSFAVSVDRGRFEWAGHDKALWRLFAQPGNLANPAFLWMLREVVRFGRTAVADLRAAKLGDVSLGGYLDRHGFSRRFREHYLLPMGAAIWSTSPARMLDFPAESFVAFFDNHRLLGLDRPVWRTVRGGSRGYIEKLRPALGTVRCGAPVVSVQRTAGGVAVQAAGSEPERFDRAVLACHADQALAVLKDADDAERSALVAVRFADNAVWLHRDPSLMPRRKAAWSAWNFLSEGDAGAGPASVTYWMNKLQPIDPRLPLFVSLNPPREPAPEAVFRRFTYAHPQLDGKALAAQKRLPALQGRRHVCFAGAWTGYGFHEDGLRSGMAAAEALGGSFPWSAPARTAA